MSNAFVRLAYQMLHGKVDPEALDSNWNYGGPLLDQDPATVINQHLEVEKDSDRESIQSDPRAADVLDRRAGSERPGSLHARRLRQGQTPFEGTGQGVYETDLARRSIVQCLKNRQD